MLKKYNLKPLVLSMFSVGLVYAGPPAVDQLPRGGQVVAGQAVIRQTGPAALNINQTSNSAVINWQTFDLGSAASVNFAQPSSSSATLNRVLDSNPSQIFGKITAPGQVFFSNPNGMVFGKDASVDVGSLTATTHSISNDDFMAGQYRFDRAGATGSIQNLGELKARLGGYIALLAPEVRNQGVVIAKMGTVALAAGEVFELQMQGSQLSGVRVTPATIQALVDNAQAVQAPGGLIILSAQAVDQLQGSVTNSGGSLSANSMKLRNGRIVLDASGSVQVTGKLEANSNKGKAGQITLTGEQITLQSGAQLEAKGATGGGTVLVGGDWQGSNGVRQAHQVDMQAGASIDASATQQGDGGKVVLWSDVHLDGGFTKANGSITARAGALGGNGGQVETSGHQVDISQAKVNAGSDKGKGGLWLLDPYDYTIDAAAASVIVSSLNLGTSFTVSTADASESSIVGTINGTAGGNGDITISSAISKTSGGDATLAPTTAGTLSGIISGGTAYNVPGSGGLTLTSGTQTLTGVNTYTGDTTVSSGTLALSGSGSIATSSEVVFSGDGVFDISGTTSGASIKGFTGSSTAAVAVNLGSKTLTLTNADGLLDAVIGGTVGLTLNSGRQSLEGVNTYTGLTTLNARGLALLRAGSIEASSGVVMSGNGQLDISQASSDVTIKALSGTSINASAMNLGANSLILSAATGGDFAGVIAGTGGLTLTTGTQTLSGANTYTGATTINGGTLTIGGTGTLGSGTYAGNISVASGATFAYSSSTAQTLSGVISGAGALTKDTETSTLTLSGTNTYTGATTLSAGTLALSGSGSIATSSGVTVSGDGVLDISATTSGASIVSLDGSSTATVGVNLGAQTLTLSSASGSYSGVIDGTGGVTLTTGTQTLSGTNTYTGATTIDGGTLTIGGTGTLGSGTYAGDISVASGATLQYSSSTAQTLSGVISGAGALTKDTETSTLTLTGTNTYSGDTTVSAGTLTIGGTGTLGSGTYAGDISVATDSVFQYSSSTNQTLSGVISGAGALTKDTGTSTLTLTGTNTYTGATTLSAGTLSLSGSGSVATSSGLTVSGDGVLDISATTSGASIVSLDGSSTAAVGVNLGTKTLTLSSASGSYSGVIDGTGGVTLTTGTQTLTGDNTYTGATIIDGGTLALSGSGSIATSSGVTVSGDGVLDISATTSGASIVSLDGSSTATVGVNLGAQTLTLSSASGSYSGVIDGTGGVTLTTGTQTLTGDNTYSGTTTISAGTLLVGDGGSTGALGTGSVTNNGALEFNRGANTSISNVISGTGSVTATITGTLSVDASITSAGGTSLSSTGNLSLNADITNNTTGDITLSAGNGSSASTATLTAADGVVVTQNANADVVMRTDGQGNLTPAQINKAGTGAGDIILAAGRLISAGTGTGGQVTPLSNSTVTNSGTGKLLVYSGTKADSGDLSAMDSSLGSLVESGTPSSINMAYNKAYGSSISNGAYSQVLFRENPYAVTTTDQVTLPFITLNLASPSLHTSKFNLDLNLEEGLASQLPLDMDIPMPWHLLSSLGNGPLVLQNYDGRPLPSWVSLDLEKKALVLKQAPLNELPLRIWVVSGLQRSLVQVNKMKPKSLN